MTTEDLRRIDELVQNADMAVRVASQLTLWRKRKSVSDLASIEQATNFLKDALSGGRFVQTGEMSAAASLTPLTWSADVRFGFSEIRSNKDVEKTIEYRELLEFLSGIHQTLLSLTGGLEVVDDDVEAAASFFSQLGQFLGSKADNALRAPTNSSSFSCGEFSYQ